MTRNSLAAIHTTGTVPLLLEGPLLVSSRTKRTLEEARTLSADKEDTGGGRPRLVADK